MMGEDPLAKFRLWSSEQLEQWLEEHVLEHHDGLFDAVLLLWCERFPVLDEETWKRLSQPLDVSRRAVDPAEIQRYYETAMGPPEGWAEEPELTWHDQMRIAAFAGDYGEEAASGYLDYEGQIEAWDEDNPDPYLEDDPGDYFERELNSGGDLYGDEQPGDYFAWLSNQPPLEEDADPEWDEWLAPTATRSGTAVAAPPTQTSPAPAPARQSEPAEPEPQIQFTNPNLQKGYEFEQWVLSRFKRGYFGLLEWRSDKNLGDWRPQSSGYPDLVMTYPVPRAGRRRFAVECKWRRKARIIHLPLAPRMERYRQFAREFSMTVVLVLGVGGKPSAPDNVYIIPIDQAPHGDQPLQALARFRRPRPAASFFWDPRAQTLG